MTVAGLIFSNIHDAAVPELTGQRTMASIPFGGRYRLIDFALSGMVNSGVTKVGIITHYNYQSLLDHLGTGKDWDLARRQGGIKILPPFITAYDNAEAGRLYTTRLEALMGVMNFIDRCTEDTMVLADCDVICNMDLHPVIAAHEQTGADITLITVTVTADENTMDANVEVPVTDGEGRLLDIAPYAGQRGRVTICTDILLVRRAYLRQAVSDAVSHGYRSFYRDVVYRNRRHARVFTYEYDGFFARVHSLASYFAASMRLLDHDERVRLFYRHDQPIFTKIRNSAPTRYVPGCRVTGSLVADGCVIEGEVENSVLFRGVKVGRGAKIKNAILMQDTVVGENTRLSGVITDKNVVIRDGRELCGHETLPFYIGKNMTV